MVTFICVNAECPNKDVIYNFLGNPETAMCGGCKETLTAADQRPDPVIEEVTLNAITD
jgi:hypothetical protein